MKLLLLWEIVIVMINCDRTSCRQTIQSVPASRSSDFVNHLYDFRPNWTPLSPITVINNTDTFSSDKRP